MKLFFRRITALLVMLCLLCPAVLAEEDFALFEEVELDDDFWDENQTGSEEEDEPEFFIGDGTEAIAEDMSNLARDPDVNPDDLEINPNLSPDVINILLIGVDSRDTDLNAASGLFHNDVTMILSVNTKDGSVKLTSIARDLFVTIPGVRDMSRINNAYAFGSGQKGTTSENRGTKLAMRTVNHNFELNISQYVVINFYGVASIIDHLGGVDVDLVKGEALAINNYIKEKARRMTYDTKGNKNREPLEVRKSMASDEKYVLHLDGIQALMYARLRSGMKYNTGDFYRTGRQRHLLELLLRKVLTDIDLEKLSELITVAYPYVKTNISADTIFNISVGVLRSGIRDRMEAGEELFEQFRLPMDYTYDYQDVDGASVVVFKSGQFRRAVETLHHFIYGEYEPSGR